MKLVSYLLRDGVHYGAVVGDRVVDLTTRLPYAGINEFIAANAAIQVGPTLERESGDYDYNALTLLPVIPNPGKIICIGINYEDHRVEAGRDKTEHPMVFARFAESQTAHRAPILRAPHVSTQFDYEAELLVVIGKRTPRYTRREDALSYVFGYSCYNDTCHRDWQFHTRQITPGKNFESTGASGPWIVTADQIPDPQKLHIEMRLNGKVMQDAHTSQMVWPINVLIEYITSWIPLNPGDLIVSGTPGGVGFKRNPPVFMQPGDIAEVEIEGIGTLRNLVADE
jgi:2-keto-4-pentenoate hydratase/2-oxohepta-3-ene-1,7-dioic acid hydratase in catechol pathway